MDSFTKSFLLLFMLLNPFLLIIYLIDLVQEMKLRDFSRVLNRAGWISSGILN